MSRAVMCAQKWAQQHFSQADLGDVRRCRRAVNLARALAESEGGPLPMALPHWGQLKAAYRLLSRPEVTYEELICPHWELTRRRCEQPGTYLMIEDTTDIDFTGRQVGELMGWTGDGGGRGLYLHSTLAARLWGWEGEPAEPQAEILGLLGQKVWARRHAPRTARESRSGRLSRERESERWAAVWEQLAPPRRARWIYAADRDSDVYEAFVRCRDGEVDFVVRASQNRALEGQEGHLFDVAASGKVLAQQTLKLRARPGVAARTVTVQLRGTSVMLRPPYRPGKKLEPLAVNLLDVRQIRGPVAGRPLHWVLLTSLPCGGPGQAERVVWLYRQRWLIEEYHKALKTGAGMEKTQLRSADGVMALLGINAVVAVRLLQMKLLARCRPQEPIAEGFLGKEALQILQAAYGEPPQGWTYASVMIAIARLGGFLARKGDGLPGWLTIWRGWRRLVTMVQGLDLVLEKA